MIVHAEPWLHPGYEVLGGSYTTWDWRPPDERDPAAEPPQGQDRIKPPPRRPLGFLAIARQAALERALGADAHGDQDGPTPAVSRESAPV